MKKAMKKMLALLLMFAMILSAVPVSAATVTNGENGKNIYLALDFYSDIKNLTKATEFAANDTFYIEINFAGNPENAKETLTGFSLAVGYDSKKMSAVKAMKGVNGAITPEFNANFATGVFSAVSGFANGLTDDFGDIITSGTLFYVQMKATSALTAADLNNIVILPSAQGASETMDTRFVDNNKSSFTIIQTPAISVGNVVGNIYTSSTAADIKSKIQSFSYIDNSGETTTYTNTDSQWADFEVILPSGGLAEGTNILTAKFGNYTATFEITVKVDTVSSIEITTPSAKTAYTAFEKFDKAGMVVTATYESGATKDVTSECVVDTNTELKVADTNWKITYGGLNVNQAITVSPLAITVPVASTASLTYTGAVQEFAYSTDVDETYVSVSGETSGKDAKTYNATASLKDKNNTVWANGTAAADVQLSWTIDKAGITSGLDAMTKKYTTTYAELPTEANVIGVNSESVTATISWYTDAACETAAADASQIAASYTGAGQTATLYYKATGMKNYANYKGSVIVNITDKDAAVVTWKTLPSGLSKSGENIVGTYSKAGYAVLANMFEVKTENGSLLGTPANILIAKNGTAVDAIRDAGTYTVTVGYEDKDYKALKEFTVVISPKSIEGLKVSLKIGEFDAVTTTETSPALVTYTGDVIIPEIVGVEGLTAGDYLVDSEVQGATLSAKDVSGETYFIAVKGTGNYSGTSYGYWKIAPAEITIEGAVIANKVYNGNVDDAFVENVIFTGLKSADALVKGVDYEITSAVYGDKNVGDNVTVNVTVLLKNTVKNYVLNEQTVTSAGKITQAPAPSISAPAVQTLLSSSVVADAKEYTFNLDGILSGIPGDAGTVSYSVKEQGAYATVIVEGSSLKANVAQAKEAGVTDTVMITVSSTNYENKDVTISFEFKNKTSVEITLDYANFTYDGEEHAVSGSYANQPQSGYTWTYQYEGIEGTVYPASNVAPVNAGKYRVTAKYEDNTPDSEHPEIPGHVGEKIAILTIAKKELTITDGDVEIKKEYDSTTDAGTLTGALALDGIVGEDEVLVDMSAATVSEYGAATVGTYTVEIGGFELAGADKDNYTISSTYNFVNAKIIKKNQSAVKINDSAQDISKAYGDDFSLVLSGGDGTGAYKLTSSDSSVLKLTAGTDNTWAAEILKIGTVTLTASKMGDSNYEDSEELSVSVVISPRDIVEGDFEIDLAEKTFAASEIKPAVTSETLQTGVDYEVYYSNNVNVGTATIKIEGKGNFASNVTKTFVIVAKELTEADFVVSGLADSYVYTGEQITPTTDVKWNDIVLVKDTDYDVAFADNVNAGTATLTITGKNNYNGTLSKTYNITPAVYNGSASISANQTTITVGTELTANAPLGDVLSYQWKRNDEDIENATNATYTVTEDDIDAEITVVVTSSGNYVGEVESSAVSVGKTILSGAVSISGTTEIVATITDAPQEGSYKVVWMRNDCEISGVDGTTYTVTDSDKGCEILVKLVAIGDVYTGEIVSNSIFVPAGVPSFASAPVATAGNGSVTVNFAAKANGAQIMNYEIIVDGSVVATIDGNQTSYAITGLVNGTQYQIKVAAINSVGRTESETVTATPFVYSGGGGGGGGVSSNKVAVSTTTGGKITTSIKNASAGSTVVIKATPNEGYKLSDVIVRDKNGNIIPVTIDGLSCTFKMPKTAVTIEPVFVKDDAKDEEPTDKPDTTEFNDVKATAYYYDAVKWAVEKGITSGAGENTFSPDGECSRAQIVTFLWRAAGSPKVDDFINPFADIDGDAYYYDAVMWTVKNGMTLGVSETAFAPDVQVNRAQSVTFLWRFAGLPKTDAKDAFSDVTDGDYYGQAVAWAANENVTKGLTESTFGPEDVCVRAQIVTFIYRYFVK